MSSRRLSPIASKQRFVDAKKRLSFSKPSGEHGFDNQLVSMCAMFIAHGKVFRKRKLVDPFPNVDVYNLMCNIPGLTPAPNDDDLDRVKKMLR